MTYRHFLGASALLVTVTFTGCASRTSSDKAADEPPQQAERVSQLAQSDSAAAPADQEHRTDLDLSSSRSTENILAQKTASYAQEIERLLAERAREGAAARAAANAAAAEADLAVSVAPTTRPAANAAATIAPAPAAPATPSASTPPAQSQVVFADPRQLPPAQPPPRPASSAAPVSAPATVEAKPTVHQLLDTAPATANQAQHIPAPGEPVAAAAQQIQVVDVKPEPARQRVADLLNPADPLATRLAERIAADPLDVSAHLDYQLLRMLNDQSVPELQAIAPLPQEDREILSAVLDGLSNFRHTIRTGGNALLGQKIGPIVEMGERVRNQTSLAIPTLVLCRDVKQFGIYQRLESTRFPFGAKHPVVVYCEVANFLSQLNSSSLWETKLTYEVLLYTENASLQVWQHKPTPVIDHCNSRRRDFFIAKLLELPQDLPIGGYLMKVSIVDETANRIAEATVPLQIVAK